MQSAWGRDFKGPIRKTKERGYMVYGTELV
jgi:hypothetical protein